MVAIASLLHTELEPLPLRDEKTFTDDEMIAAFAILLAPDRARDEGLAYNALPDLKGIDDALPEELAASHVKGPRSYDGDILDLLSLVSESCAERAWALLGITRAEGESRRDSFRRRVDEALRLREKPQGHET
jgi:hypothetical protein